MKKMAHRQMRAEAAVTERRGGILKGMFAAPARSRFCGRDD
jgi:hypothetical protein